MLSAIILTHNNENTIRKCLKSVRWADEVIIVDDYSTDNTAKIAKKFKTKIYKRKLNKDFSSQRNFGLTKVRGDWVLFVDSDERISAALAAEIKSQISNLKSQIYDGFYLNRKDKFMGKWLRFGETASVKLLRLARNSSKWRSQAPTGAWHGKVHETWQIKGKAGQLKNPLLHHRSLSISQFLKNIDRYSTIRAEELYKNKVKEGFLKIFAYPAAKFFQNYFLRLGILDGLPGFIIAILMSWHSLLVRVKLRLLWRIKKGMIFNA